MKTILGAIILAIGIAMSGNFIADGIIGFKKLDRIVTVRGLDERMIKSDQGIWKLEYAVAADDLKSVTASSKSYESAIRQFVVDKGFKEEEIQTPLVRINDSQTEEYSSRKGPRYVARGTVIVTSASVDLITAAGQQASDLLDKGIMISNNSVQYFFNGLNDVKPEMLKAATASARDAATSFAQDSGSKLGKIKSAEQGLFSISSQLSEYDSTTSLMKKVRVVTHVQFYLE